MSEFRLLTFAGANNVPQAGILVGETVFAAAKLLAGSGVEADSTLTILRNWDAALPALLAAAENTKPAEGQKLADTRLLAPILYPGAVFCAGANYTDHLFEMTGHGPPDGVEPFFFLKAPQATIIGPGDTIRLPTWSKNVDWEAEIALVIGHTATNISEADAMSCVAGFTILHDVSARDAMKRDDVPFAWDWLAHKSFDTSAPMGPWITPRDAVANPYDMSIRLWVNNELKQASSSANLICGYEKLISYLSERTTLYPGDVIATGTPAGVGMPKGTFLNPGDTVRIQVGGIGELVNPVSN